MPQRPTPTAPPLPVTGGIDPMASHAPPLPVKTPPSMRAATGMEKLNSRFLDFYDWLAGGVGQIPGLKLLGFDPAGVVEQAAQPSVTYAAPFPVLGKVPGGAARQLTNGFYSRLDEAAAMLPPKGAKAQSVLNLLKKAPGGVSEEEIALRGLPEWLASKGSATVTPDDLMAYLQSRPAPFPNVSTRGHGSAAPYKDIDDVSQRMFNVPYDMLDNADKAAAQQELFNPSINRDAPTKYARYQVPGGENYRETLLTLPTQGSGGHRVRVYTSDGTSAVQIMDDAAIERMRASGRRKFEVLDPVAPESSFQSSHFDDPNILVHTRANDRTIPSGERVRHIEEVQSDWHQAGKQKGYVPRGGRVAATRPEDMNVDELAFALGGGDDVVNRGNLPGVPDAPFKETWPDLGLKQQIYEAAQDPSIQGVTVTGGKTQAARYDLSKQISEVHYSGTNLKAYDLNGETVINQTGVTPEQLPDYIGKEAAKKLMDQPQRGTLRSLTGVDLQVGGEGMREFYDKLVPKRMEKALKPFGGTVEPGSVNTLVTGHTRVQGPNGPYSKAVMGNEPAWFARLTPEMKARIAKEGFPLMSLLALMGSMKPQPSHGDSPIQ